MIPPADWLLAALSLASCWLMGSGRRAAWLLSIATNLAGAGYFARTGQGGLVALEACFVAVNARGWWRWTPEPPAARTELADLIAPYRQTRPPVRHAANVRIPAAPTTEATR